MPFYDALEKADEALKTPPPVARYLDLASITS
jgi:hypothetical protein